MKKTVKITEKQLHNIVKSVICEAMKEMDLYHGTKADFDQFDLAYMSTGWGKQAHGYGFYLIDDYEAAKSYSLGGQIMTVQVPDKGYLSDKKISMTEKKRIANKLYRLFTVDDPDRRLSYQTEQEKRDCWEYEIKCILDCYDGNYVYGTVNALLGDDKETTQFLHNLGYVGLKVPDEVTHSTIYVIFDPNDMKIIKKDKVNNDEL